MTIPDGSVAMLAPAALTAAKQMRYTPCVVNSEAVETITSIQIIFKLVQ
jgi:hypothetical protein